MKSLYITLLSAAMSLSVGASAQTTEAVLDLTDRTTFDNCTQTSIKYDHNEYNAWTFNNYGKYPYMYNSGITEPYYSDYLITPEVTLKAFTLYRIEVSPAAYNSRKTTSLTIGLGQGNDLSKYKVLASYDNLAYANKSTATQKTVEFHVDADGQYKLYFLGETNGMYLFDTKVVEVGSSNVPLAAEGLTLVPASDGSASVTVSFTLPSATISGQPLDGTLKYSIFRGDGETAVKTGRGAAGEYVSYTDNDCGEGTVSYSVTVESAGNTSERVTASTYVGKETPNPVTDLAVSANDDSYTLSWKAPATGVHGAFLDPSSLTYRVTRIVDDVPTIVAEACTATTFIDNYTSGDLQSLQYSVVAVLNGVSSEEVKTKTLAVGSLTLPFTDSFAGASFGKVWTADIVSGTINWEAVASSTAKRPIVSESIDQDGGFAIYRSWDATRGCSARLASAPIKYVAGSSPIIEFYVYRTTGNDQIQIQVSCDNGDWTNVPDALITLKSTTQNWEKVEFPLAAAIADGCKTFRVAFLSLSAYGQNTVIDKVRVFVPADKDLEVSSVVAPTSVYSGNDINLSFAISNNSAKVVSAADYTLKLVTDYPESIALPTTVDIPTFGSTTVDLIVPVTAIEVQAADSYSFALQVVYDGDEKPENNISTAAEVAVAFVEEASPTNPDAKQLADGSIEVSWGAAGDGHTPLSVSTSFEGSAGGFTGPFDGFTALDLDQAAGDSYYMASGSAFSVVNKPSVPRGRDGDNVIGLTLGANKQQDDWLISPVLDCKAGATMDLNFLVATKKFTSSSYYYTMEILYSTEADYDAANPSAAFTNKVNTLKSSLSYGQFINSETFVPISITGIPSETKRVAIHFISKIPYTSAIWIDNVRITEAVSNPLLGYNVYENGVGRVNAEMVEAATTSFNIPETSIIERRYFITAVYGSGESQPTDLTPYFSAVNDIAGGEGPAVNVTSEGLVVSGADNAVVYDLQGRIAAYAPRGIVVRLAPGMYIVKAGSETCKVMVGK